jgi:hypothetical protein
LAEKAALQKQPFIMQQKSAADITIMSPVKLKPTSQGSR